MTIHSIQVTVSNLWTAPEKVRSLDEASLTTPVDLNGWLAAMDGQGDAGRLDLLGRLESQLLYGEPVKVIDEKEGWVNICALEQNSPKDKRGYPGWIPVAQLTHHPDYSRAWSTGPFAYVITPKTRLIRTGLEEIVPLSFMTKLPWIGETDGEALVLTPDGTQGRIPAGDVEVVQRLPITSGLERIQTAKKFLGLPYLWGGTSSYGFDCSGLMYRIFASGGILIPRDASVQAEYGQNIPLDQLEPGDLLFFAYEKGRGRIHHVGMYIGEGSFIHSPRTGYPITINRLTDPPYAEELCRARRYDGTEFST